MKTVMLRNVEVGCGKPKVIVPIVAATAQGILEKAREFRAHALDVVEWRVDFYEDVFQLPKVLSTLKGLREILGETPILFTFRTRKEGGEKEIDMEAYTARTPRWPSRETRTPWMWRSSPGTRWSAGTFRPSTPRGKRWWAPTTTSAARRTRRPALPPAEGCRSWGRTFRRSPVMPRCPGDVIALLDATRR